MRGGSGTEAIVGTATVGCAATVALLGGATPSQLCLMLSRVASRCSTCCRARAIAGTSRSATAIASMNTREIHFMLIATYCNSAARAHATEHPSAVAWNAPCQSFPRAVARCEAGTAFQRGHDMVIPFILLVGAVTVAVLARKRRGATEHNDLDL